MTGSGLFHRLSMFGYTQLMSQSAVICARCHAQSFAGAAFCQNCGSTLGWSAREASAEWVPWTLPDIGRAIGLVVLTLIATLIPAGIVAWALAGSDQIEDDPEALTVALASGVFLELALLLTAVHFGMRKYGTGPAALGLRPPSRGGFWLTVGLVVVLVIGGLTISFAYESAMEAVGIDPDIETEQVFQSAGPLIALAILSLLFAPLMEEVFFRGFVFGGLRSYWGTAPAILGSGLLFALAHIGNPGGPYLLLPIAAIGALFAWGYAWSGSILSPLLAHTVFNLIALVDGIARHS